MLQCAIDSASREGLSNVSFERADAQTHAFESGVYDAVFSRFGVMFFADPRAAFANLRGALRPGGVLAFICWRGLENNEWMIVPLRAALEHLPAPEPPEPGAPGPFAYADPIRVRDFLEGAGYQDLTLEQLDQPMTVGAGLDLDQTVDFALQMGPTGRMLREVDPALRPVVAATVRKALEPFLTEDGVRMASSAWIVTARNPEK
jgi:SAM-dependent methyltransferase